MKSRRKKQKGVRARDWADAGKYDTAFTHDRAKHRRAQAGFVSIPSNVIPPEKVRPNGLVVSHSGRWGFVSIEGEEVLCVIDEGLGEGRVSVLAPGDEVQVEYVEGQPVVRGVGPRRTKLSRLAHEQSRVQEQVIAANVDILVIVSSAVQPRFKPGLVDRYLAAASVGGVEPVLALNKMDLVEAAPAAVAGFRELGLRVFNTSAATGAGVGELRGALEGKLAVMSGQSGVGKTALLNAMDPSLDLATQEVSTLTEKGKHTTSAGRLFRLEGDIKVIDTPGIRQLGLWGISHEEIAFYFPEIAELAAGCRFRNCTHIHEPDCAVRDGVEAGKISMLRYNSYRHIRESLQSG
ncbi:MAG TPA: ribosome small subunit-dependent GTPase A [Candidatus Bathyarchaeia archaeon]|nr:ribosome small subunit-dependent GTPase A [Candidatus Bathyarchaeia archaeon]